MSLCYPTTKHSADEIEVIAEMWVESLVDISPDVFVDACRLHREQSYWFPTLVEVLDRCKDVWAQRERETKKRPGPEIDITPEQAAENARKIKKMLEKNRIFKRIN